MLPGKKPAFPMDPDKARSAASMLRNSERPPFAQTLALSQLQGAPQRAATDLMGTADNATWLAGKKWFETLQRSVNKPLEEDAREPRRGETREQLYDRRWEECVDDLQTLRGGAGTGPGGSDTRPLEKKIKKAAGEWLYGEQPPSMDE